ncbi:glycosyltransferase [Kocuria sp.]|uniref:glycosyltransferase n=1 Tax=Kocuria sp. TaxID=1871328 RepID=UPI0026DEF4CD|nr:glycosyltransferase [Kocuria sp.]MDO5617797.1 glycosyltransferase [Kocuria sp.]
MHDDERRAPQQAQRLLTAQIQRDPELAIERLQQNQASIRALTANVAQLEAKLRAERVAKGKLARQVREAEAELAHSSQAGGNNASERVPSVDASPVPADPVQEPAVGGNGRDVGAPAVDGAPGQPVDVVETAAAVVQPDVSLPELLERLAADPSPTRLAACLNRLWYRHGEINRCMDLIHTHQDLLPGMTSSQRSLVGKVQGTVRLEATIDRIIPQRSLGAAYRPETDRVMYCAYSTPVYHSNGYSIRTRGVVAGLRAAGADVFVVGRTGYPWDMNSVAKKPAKRRRQVAEMDGVDYVHLPEGDVTSARPDDYIQIAADSYVREARLRRPSLIQAASNYLNGLPALIAARRLGLPFVYEVRGLWEVTEASAKTGWENSERYAWQAGMEALVAQQADTVLAITQETKDELVRRGVEAEKIELLPNGVDSHTFLPIPRDDAYAKEHGISLNVPVIGFAGSLVDYEGLDILLQAANILRGRKKDCQIVIAGSGGVYDELKSYKSGHKLGWRVRFVGRRPASEIPRFLSCVDIVACPRKSLPVTEMVSPLKPLEAFAASKPVIVSDVSPHRTLVGENQERGLLAQPGNARSLADAIQTLIEDPELSTAKGRAGRLWAVDHRQWSHLGKELVQGIHPRAAARHAELAALGPTVKELRIGVIADEFTTKTLQRSATIIPLDRSNFSSQLETENLDFILIESAWTGNDGQWHRGVGYYSEEDDADLSSLLDLSRAANIPSLFWNKEDPVHIARFRKTGSRVDHVFTTDADMISEYLGEAHREATEGVVTASSLPFYADPTVHNPLPSQRPYEDTIAYAGTFYGERYAQRSAQLTSMLRCAKEHGLVIYDRQLAVPDSPYRFPQEFAGHVAGALPYDQVLDSYKSHVVNLNVNSVGDSPTMYSRRVVEIAASGGVLLSSWSRAITEVFGGQIPNTNNDLYWRAYLSAWTSDPTEHLAEAWLQMRSVLRSHTVSSALILMARTAGIPVQGLPAPAWGTDMTEHNVDELLTQSIRPSVVRVKDTASTVADRAHNVGVPVIGAHDTVPKNIQWWACFPKGASRTWAEDVLSAEQWGDWPVLVTRYGSDGDARVLAQPGSVAKDHHGGMVATTLLEEGSAADILATSAEALNITLPTPPPQPGISSAAEPHHAPVALRGCGTVLVAGHDLKFAQPWIDHLKQQGVTVLVDQWENHAEHDEERSTELLAQADTVFCEWGLGNAVWYSRRVRDDQKLVVRVHAQELRRPYLSKINHRAVDTFIFVGELMREAAVQSHGVPRSKTGVIPNIVRADQLALPKTAEAEFTLGLVGIVPQIKRLDRAITVIENLAQRDDRWRLRIKGKRPEDYQWMLRREDEMAWYTACYSRINNLNQAMGREVVGFDPHGNDMPEWFTGIGYGLSVSDLESFHLTLPDAAASGAVPVSLAWPGADRIYPREWLVASLDNMADHIAHIQSHHAEGHALRERATNFVRDTMSEPHVFQQLDLSLMAEHGKDAR